MYQEKEHSKGVFSIDCIGEIDGEWGEAPISFLWDVGGGGKSNQGRYFMKITLSGNE